MLVAWSAWKTALSSVPWQRLQVACCSCWLENTCSWGSLRAMPCGPVWVGVYASSRDLIKTSLVGSGRGNCHQKERMCGPWGICQIATGEVAGGRWHRMANLEGRVTPAASR